MTLLRRAPYWISLPAAVGLAIWLSLAGPERAFSVPINESSGALHYMAQAKATLDHGWWWTNPSLSAPSSLHAAVLPRVSSVDHTILLAVGLFTSEVASAVNIAWLVMLMLGGVSTAWCLRRLGSSSWAAWVAGALFGLCPFALYYNISEPSLMPYLVPFAATAALALATNRWAEWPRRDRRVVLAGCVLLGSNGLDLAYFGTWLTAIGAIAGAVWVRSRARLAQGSAVPALIVLAVTVSLLPMMVARQQEGYSVDEHFLIGETERSGLKIRQLLGPLPEHWLPFIRKWSAREGEARFPYESENQYARLGIVAGVGFIGLVAALLLPSVAGSSPHGDTIRSASRLTFALLLLATVGGFGALIGLFISPRVYIYSRAAPYVVFFSLAVIAFWLDRVAAGRPVGRLVCAGVLVLGVADQLVAARLLNKGLAKSRVEYRQLRAFVGALEERLPPGAMVFQLPVRPFPYDSRLVGIMPYEQFKPYLVSHHLRWSYPALTQAQIRDEAARAGVDPAALPARLAQDGFAAVLVDRKGYDDGGVAIVAALLAASGQTLPVAQSCRYVAIDVRR